MFIHISSKTHPEHISQLKNTEHTENSLEYYYDLAMFSFPHVHFYANAVGFTTSNHPEFPLNRGRAGDLHQHTILWCRYTIISEIQAPRPAGLGAGKGHESEATFPPQVHISVRDQREAFPKRGLHQGCIPESKSISPK